MALEAISLRPHSPGIRRRPDLVVVDRCIRGANRWIVKDPISLAYFDLSEAEYTVLTLLDGERSGEEILTRLNSNLSVPISREQLEAFVRQLLRQSLAVSGATIPSSLEATESLPSRLNHLFSLRLRGMNPTWLLDRLGWLQRMVFSRAAGLSAVVLVTLAALLVMTRFDEVVARIPGLHSFFSGSNLLWLILVWFVTKVIHEMGHALTCRHYGGECREAGVMLLFLTPCLYCDVSDSWMFRSRWKRLAVSAAGIVVELVLASASAILWFFSEPGLFNSLCLNMMIVSSVGALAFNGNPLLRYDGYYILSDLLDFPNLRGRADNAVRNFLRLLFHGPDAPLGPLSGQITLAAFSVSSFVYRVTIVVAIVCFIAVAAEPYGLAGLTVPLGIVTTFGLLQAPIAAVLHEVRVSAGGSYRRLGRAHAVILGLCALLLIALLLPLPRSVRAAAVIEPSNSRHVYVTSAGTLIKASAAGTRVQADEVVGQLQNLELERKIVETRGRLAELERRLDDLRTMRTEADPRIAGSIEPLAARIAGVKEELKGLDRDLARLTLRAPRSGIVIPPPNLEQEPTELELPLWTSTPLEPRNQKAFLETGTLFCAIGNPNDVCALALLSQDDVEAVREGQSVRIVADHLPGNLMTGEVIEVAKVELDWLPVELVGDPDIKANRTSTGVNRPTDTSYFARVRLDEPDHMLLAKGKASLRISVDPEPLVDRLYRALRRTFRVQL